MNLDRDWSREKVSAQVPLTKYEAELIVQNLLEQSAAITGEYVYYRTASGCGCRWQAYCEGRLQELTRAGVISGHRVDELRAEAFRKIEEYNEKLVRLSKLSKAAGTTLAEWRAALDREFTFGLKVETGWRDDAYEIGATVADVLDEPEAYVRPEQDPEEGVCVWPVPDYPIESLFA